MSGLGSGFVNLFKGWGRGIGNAADKLLLGADARKAISDEVINKFQPMIERAQRAESKRAANIKDLDVKLNESKANWKQARDDWQKQYDAALANAKNQRQTDIADYDAKLQGYQDALANANKGKQDILNQLYDSEARYDLPRTIFKDVNTGKDYIYNPFSGGYKSLDSLNKKERKKFLENYENFDTRLFDSKSGNVINAFDKSNIKNYKGNAYFDNYYSNRISTQNTALRDAKDQIKRANSDLTTWSKNNNRPADWDDQKDLGNFDTNFRANNAEPNEYSFNGKNYSKESDLDAAYQKALNHAQYKRDYFRTKASDYASERDKEIATRIQDAKDIKKAKLALGAGALYAGARAMYGGDDTDNTDNIDNTNNIDNTDNTYTGERDPNFNVKKEGQAILNDRQQIDTGFDPDKAEAVATLAAAAHDTGAEDGNSIESSGDLGNNIGATTRGHTMEDRLYELIKAMQDPYKADAVANYIYSRHGDDPEVQRLGWRGWLNKYYGDSLRSKMNIDPSGYKGMHISGGL